MFYKHECILLVYFDLHFKKSCVMFGGKVKNPLIVHGTISPLLRLSVFVILPSLMFQTLLFHVYFPVKKHGI